MLSFLPFPAYEAKEFFFLTKNRKLNSTLWAGIRYVQGPFLQIREDAGRECYGEMVASVAALPGDSEWRPVSPTSLATCLTLKAPSGPRKLSPPAGGLPVPKLPMEPAPGRLGRAQRYIPSLFYSREITSHV